MKPLLLLVLAAVSLTAISAQTPSPDTTLQRNPENSRYFLWRGKPAVLITSAEHYGAVLNLDFNYIKYLDALAADGCNLTRTFTGGAYIEPQGAFNITANTLAPAAGRFIAPWARSDQPGAADGGNKHDLSRWNEAYFVRFRDFAEQASKRGIVIEVNLFCPFYEDAQWKLSPFNASNNINNIGNVPRDKVYTLDQHGGLLGVQERMVRKFVDELRDFDNIYYEICNEPYFGGVTLDWQRRIAEVIVEAQREHPFKKLIAQNIANGSAIVKDSHPAVSIFNFHYTAPPVAVAQNAAIEGVIGENETGFRGTGGDVYRVEAWDFLIAGGGLFNNLDYSFAAGHEDGSYQYPPKTPGSGGVEFRRQLRVLRGFINGFEFVKMKPADELLLINRGELPKDFSVRLLAEPGRQYGLYLHHSAKPEWKDNNKLHSGEFQETFKLQAPAGVYRAEWILPSTGAVIRADVITHQGGQMALSSPVYAQDLALSIRASSKQAE